MSGCLDDVEFVLKIFKAWEELPWLNEKQVNGETGADIDELRSFWAKQQFVDHEVLSNIRLERDSVLERMFSHKKEENQTYPHIDLTLLDRVRMLFTVMLPDVTLDATRPYRFEPRPELAPGSLVTCTVANSVKLDGISGKITWLDGARAVSRTQQLFKNGIWNQNTFSRLFVDQFYPIRSRFAALITGSDQTRLSILRTGPLQKTTYVIDERNIPDVKELPHDDEERLSEEAQMEQAETEDRRTPVKKHHAAPESIETVFDDFHASLQVDQEGAHGKTGQTHSVEVIGYDFAALENPVICTSLVSQPEPFDLFAKTYRYGDDVQVEVVGLLSFVNDFTVALVVREKKTQLEILVESSDMSFTASSWEVKQIPIGTTLTMKVESINKTSRRVRLSMLPFTEQVITTQLANVKGVEEVKTVGAKVIELRPDTIIFALEWSKPEEGHSVIVSTYGRKLPKPITEYTINEPVLLSVGRRKQDVFDTSLQEIPKKASKSVPANEPSHGLFWQQGFLQHAGRMTYGELFKYKSYAGDAQYHRALDRIYWLSNRLHIMKVMDNTWAERVNDNYSVGSTHEGIVTSVHSSGIEVDLSDNVHEHAPIHGYAPKNRILNGKENPEKFLSLGDTVTVEVIEVRSEKQELLLSIIQLANDPFDAITEGDVIVGTIADKNEQLGLFVELKPGVTGLLHVSRFTDDPSFVRGARITVKVYAKDTANRRISLDLV
jgi:predicted RNA-binding protein with RPS1 domain